MVADARFRITIDDIKKSFEGTNSVLAITCSQTQKMYTKKANGKEIEKIARIDEPKICEKN